MKRLWIGHPKPTTCMKCKSTNDMWLVTETISMPSTLIVSLPSVPDDTAPDITVNLNLGDGWNYTLIAAADNKPEIHWTCVFKRPNSPTWYLYDDCGITCDNSTSTRVHPLRPGREGGPPRPSGGYRRTRLIYQLTALVRPEAKLARPSSEHGVATDRASPGKGERPDCPPLVGSPSSYVQTDNTDADKPPRGTLTPQQRKQIAANKSAALARLNLRKESQQTDCEPATHHMGWSDAVLVESSSDDDANLLVNHAKKAEERTKRKAAAQLARERARTKKLQSQLNI